jgi:RND family efflux transporter MFP subunit
VSRTVRIILITATLLGLAVLLAYFAGFFHDKVPAEAAPVTLRINGEVVQAVKLSKPLVEQVAGTVAATSDTLIASRIMARIVRINARAGERVGTGQLLVELDDEAQRAAHEQRTQAAAAALAVLEETRLTQARTASLRQSGSVSQAALDRANTDERRAAADYEQALRAAEEAKAALGYTTITAPMDGTIVERFVEPGDTATPGQPLLKLYKPGQMRVEATLRESLISFVQVGDQLSARIDAQDRSVNATVEEIVPAADPNTRTFLLKARLAEIEGLFPGMFARLFIPTVAQTRVWIPARAVQQAGQLRFVYVRAEDGDARRYVRLGQPEEAQIAVASGLAEGERVVIPLVAPIKTD